MPLLKYNYYGMKFYIYNSDFKEHNKPHIHAVYGEYEASISLDGELLAGSLPRKSLKQTIAFIHENYDAIYEAWNNAVANKPFRRL